MQEKISCSVKEDKGKIMDIVSTIDNLQRLNIEIYNIIGLIFQDHCGFDMDPDEACDEKRLHGSLSFIHRDLNNLLDSNQESLDRLTAIKHDLNL